MASTSLFCFSMLLYSSHQKAERRTGRVPGRYFEVGQLCLFMACATQLWHVRAVVVKSALRGMPWDLAPCRIAHHEWLSRFMYLYGI